MVPVPPQSALDAQPTGLRPVAAADAPPPDESPPELPYCVILPMSDQAHTARITEYPSSNGLDPIEYAPPVDEESPVAPVAELFERHPHLANGYEKCETYSARVTLQPRSGTHLECLKKGFASSKKHLGPSLNLSTFLSQTLQAQEIKDLKERPQFSVCPVQISRGDGCYRVSAGRVFATQQGHISPDLRSALIRFGLELPSLTAAGGSLGGGGHPGSRITHNCIKANQYHTIFETILQSPVDVKLIIPGSKFSSDLGYLSRGLSLTRMTFIQDEKAKDQEKQRELECKQRSLDWLWNTLRERILCMGDPSYAEDMYPGITEGWQQEDGSSQFAKAVWFGDHGIFSDWEIRHRSADGPCPMDFSEMTERFLSCLSRVPEFVDVSEKIAVAMTIAHTTVRFVRPRSHQYDDRYWKENLERTQKRTWTPGAPSYELIEGCLEDNDEHYPDDKVIYWLTDTHYYLSEWLTSPSPAPDGDQPAGPLGPANTKKGDLMFVVGNEYLPTPSLEPLPFQEGDYQTDKNGEITVRMRSSAVHYKHPNIQVLGANMSVDYLTMKVLGWSGHPGTLRLERAPATGFQCTRSLATLYLAQQLGNDVKYKSLDISSRDLPLPWTESDARSFVSHLQRIRLELDYSQVAELATEATSATLARLSVHLQWFDKPVDIATKVPWDPEELSNSAGHRVREEIKNVTVDGLMFLASPFAALTNQVLERRDPAPSDGRVILSRFTRWAGGTPLYPLTIKHAYWSSPEPQLPISLMNEDREFEIEQKNVLSRLSTRVVDVFRSDLSEFQIQALPNASQTAHICGARNDQSATALDEEPELARPCKDEEKINSILLRDPRKGAIRDADGTEDEVLSKTKVVPRVSNKELRRLKQSMPDESRLPAEDYYMCKEPDWEKLMQGNPCVIGSDLESVKRYEDSIRALRALYESFPQQMMIKGDQLLPMSDGNSACYATLSGSAIIDQHTGNPIREFEYSSKSLANVICALARHMGALQTYDEQRIPLFRTMCKAFLDELTDRINLESPEDKSIWCYVLDKDSFSRSKKKKYICNIADFFYDRRYARLVTAFQLMVKSGEVYTTLDLEKLNGCILGQSSRPRMISVMTDKGYGII